MERLQFDVESPKMTTRGPETTILENKKKIPKEQKISKHIQKVKKSVKDKKTAESLENPMRKKSLTQLK